MMQEPPTLIVFSSSVLVFFPEQAAVINNEPKTQPAAIIFSHLRFFHRHCDPPHTFLSDRINLAKVIHP